MRVRILHFVVGLLLVLLLLLPGPLHGQQDRKQVEAQLRKATAVAEATEKKLGDQDPRTAGAWAMVAHYQMLAGKYKEAEAQFRKQVAYAENNLGREHAVTGSFLLSLVVALHVQDKYAEAVEPAQRAVKILRGVKDVPPAQLGVAINWLALTLMTLHRRVEAEPYYREAVQIFRTAKGIQPAQVAETMGTYGMLLLRLDKLEEAEPMIRKALEIEAKELGPDHRKTLITRHNLAHLLTSQGKFEEGEIVATRVLKQREKKMGRNSLETALALNTLAHALEGQGRFKAAETHRQRALKIWTDVHGENHVDTAMGLHNLACNLDQQGKLKDAEKFYLRGLSVHEQVAGGNHPGYPALLLSLAALYEFQGRLARAEPLYHKALAIRARINRKESPETVLVQVSLASLEIAIGKSDQAWKRTLQALSGSRAHLVSLFRGATESERFRYVQQQSNCLDLLLSMVVNTGQERDVARLDQAYEALLASKGQIFQSMAWIRSRVLGGLDAGQQKRLQELQLVQGRLSNLFSNQDVADRQARVDALLRRQSEIEDDLIRVMSRKWVTKPPTIDAIGKALPPGSVLVDFHVHQLWQPVKVHDGKVIQRPRWGESVVSAWVLKPPDRHVQHVYLGPAKVLENHVRAYLSSMIRQRGAVDASATKNKAEAAARGGRRPELGAGKPAARLREMLWDRLRSVVGDARRVIISPDMFLATLPFETLQEKSGSYLIQKHEFVYLPAVARLLGVEAVARHDAARLLIMGGVDYGEDAAQKPRWRSLANTRIEADQVIRSYKARGDEGLAVLLSGRGATEEKLKRELPGKHLVHLATHGFFNPSAESTYRLTGPTTRSRPQPIPLRRQQKVRGRLPGFLTGLVCAGANQPPEPGHEDGLLTAEEVAWLDLQACDLVVLSACETGLGEPRSGEALMSLRRAFQQAGARTVISSLWSVGDKPTRDLMLDFYDRLWKQGKGKITALREAQLAMLQRNKKRYGRARPWTWGAFVLSGDWR